MLQEQNKICVRPLNGDDPFRRILDDFFTLGRRLNREKADVWMPPTDVYETSDNVVVKMSLPGVKTGDISVHIDGDIITVHGVRKPAESSGVVCYHQMEIRNGYFERKIAVHKPFDAEKVTARYEEGFLLITAPKTKESVSRVVTLRLHF